MGERMKDERFAEWVCTDEAGELGWGEPSHNEISELWFALAAERECVEQEKAAKAKWIITAGLRQSKVDELEARLKQTQQWRDYYRRMWHGVSVTEVEIPITDAELTNLLDKRGVAK